MPTKHKATPTKQQALPFTSRRSATSKAKGKGSKTPATAPTTPAPAVIDVEDNQGGIVIEHEPVALVDQTRRRGQTIKAEEADTDAEEALTTGKKRKQRDVHDVPLPKGKGKARADRGKKILRSRASVENTEEVQASPRRELDSSSDIAIESPDVLDGSDVVKKRRLLKHYGEVRAKMGHLEPIHSKGQRKEHTILRVFDLSYEYGPCIGMTRLQRWERAEALGLDPPTVVKEILLAEQAKDGSTLTECVFEGEV